MTGRVGPRRATERGAHAESACAKSDLKTTPEGPQSGTAIPLSSEMRDRHGFRAGSSDHDIWVGSADKGSVILVSRVEPRRFA